MVLGKDNGAETVARQRTVSREHTALTLLITVCAVFVACVTAGVVVRRVDRAEANILDALDEERARGFADTTETG
jgi:hypothetical protein